MEEKTSYHFREGELLLVDKPLDWTSFDVVNKIRYALGRRYKKRKFKVGHAGTLDPKATGLLIVCTGKATKSIDRFRDMDKAYTGTIVFGATRPSYDTETEIDREYDITELTADAIESAASKLTGEIDQVPPAYSAKKIGGKKAYKMIRKGIDPQLKSYRVTIHSFDLTAIRLPEADFAIRCSKGTYIRSVAHDIGQLLNTGSYLKTLRRTAIGPFEVNHAKSIDEWVDIIASAPITDPETGNDQEP